MTLLMTVERHLRASAMTPSRFGRDVAGDPRFVFDLRRGREPRAATRARVLAFIEIRRGDAGAAANAGTAAAPAREAC
ncbi:hypothetical protein IP88_01180 [alpha proteobacterium AAP81b]|nr:hypothetical protein IP88_01180 [alpha proteobacterium AAP81b]